jgi:tetratricopeptide (TPR) repeat protein
MALGSYTTRSNWWMRGLVALSFVAVLGCDLKHFESHTREADKDPKKAKQARQARQETVSDPATAPLPTGRPLVEREGNDSWGLPRSFVNMAGLRSLLHHGKHTELTQYVESFQRDFENDPSKEYWPVRAAEAFGSAEPELLPKLDAWVAENPSSFAPYLARGTYYKAVAWARRGTYAVKDTATSDFEAMRSTLPLARKDLERALQLSPKLIAADRGLLDVAQLLGDRELINAMFTHAKQACPTCLSPRTKYLVTLQPRWGGAYEAMEHFVRTQLDPANPKLKLLGGFVLMDRSLAAHIDKRLDEALKHAEEACAIGERWEFLLQRAEVHYAMGNVDKALADATRAIELQPELPETRSARMVYRGKLKDFEGAAEDLIATIQTRPTDSEAREWRGYIAHGLSEKGWEAHQRGDRENAIRLLELAEQFAFADPTIRKRKVAAVQGGGGKANPIDALEAKVKANPDDFRAHQQLDYAWAKKRQFDKVIALWTAYLQRHPNDANAYFERSGAYYNSRHKREAFADVEKACSLGNSTACSYAKRKPAVP